MAKDNGMLFNFQARSMQILPIHPCYRNRNEASFELIPSSFKFSETVSSDITLTSNVTFQYQNKYKVRKKKSGDQFRQGVQNLKLNFVAIV